MSEKGTEQAGCLLLIFEGVADFVVEMFNIVRNKVGEVTVLRMVPDLLGRIQLRSVCGKPLERKPLGMLGFEMFGCRAMYAVPIPDQNNLATEVTVHLSQKPDHVLRLDVMLKQLKIQTRITTHRRQREGGDSRQPVVPIPRPLNRRLAAGCPRATAHRLQHEAAFIEKYDASLFFNSLFLMRGHFLRRQRWMATSSRSLARCSGF